MGANIFNFQTAFLISLICNNTKVSNLDLSNSANLTELIAYSAQLTDLNLKNENNTNITNIETSGNFDLFSICVDDATYSNNNWASNVDTWTSFTENCSLSLEEFDTSFNLNIYPNPVERLLIIQSTATINSLELYDVNGKILIKTNNTKSLDLSSLSQGVYFITIITNHTSTTKKIIKK